MSRCKLPLAIVRYPKLLYGHDFFCELGKQDSRLAPGFFRQVVMLYGQLLHFFKKKSEQIVLNIVLQGVSQIAIPPLLSSFTALWNHQGLKTKYKNQDIFMNQQSV